LPAPPRTQLVEAPHIEVPQGAPNALNLPQLPAPQQHAPPPPEPSQNPFEPVGGPRGSVQGQSLRQSKVEIPDSSLDKAMREVARSGAVGQSVETGDAGGGRGGNRESVLQTGNAGVTVGAPELLSDPQGTDFKGYRIQLLVAVRRSWYSVWPESARFGRSGRVVLQFSVNRAGQVPKLVIITPSGVEALDRAAVAGISGAVPLPALPATFKGQEVRLQLVFSYNMPRQ
jgi:TonB family protein